MWKPSREKATGYKQDTLVIQDQKYTTYQDSDAQILPTMTSSNYAVQSVIHACPISQLYSHTKVTLQASKLDK